MTQADLILTGGRVWRGLAEGCCEALAIRAGVVLATGTAAEIAALRGPATRVIDLAGRLATPGLNDAHMHLLPYGLAMAEVDLRPAAAPTLEALLEAVRARAAATPKGDWVIGRGYDHFRLDVGRHPRRAELDAAAPDHPVFVWRTDGHLGVANSAAFARAGIGPDTQAPPGGVIERDTDGLTGLVAETARELFLAAMPATDEAAMVEAIARAGRDLLSRGVTSCMDAAVGMRDGWAEMLAYRRARAEDRLPVRVFATAMADPGRSIMAELRAEGLRSGDGDAWLRIGGVKIFTDGSAGGRTAYMSQPYLGGEDRGVLCVEPDWLREQVLEHHLRGWRMAVHAIGDAAIEHTLAAIEAALAVLPDPDRRHRVEHCGWLTEAQLDRMAAARVLPVPQPVFNHAFGDLYLHVVERARAEASYPMRAWAARGLHPSASTDCPICDIAPGPNLYAMTTRRTLSGDCLGEDQRLTPAEALHAYTWSAAYATKEERLKGRLLPGQLADVAVWRTDILQAPPEALLDLRCALTIIDGAVAHEAP